MYHDGYADGYERAEAEAVAAPGLRAALELLEAAVNEHRSLHDSDQNLQFAHGQARAALAAPDIPTTLLHDAELDERHKRTGRSFVAGMNATEQARAALAAAPEEEQP